MRGRRSPLPCRRTAWSQAQADCSLDEALQMMCDRATVNHSTLDEIVAAVIDRSIRFGE
jgi:hypothetical protein